MGSRPSQPKARDRCGTYAAGDRLGRDQASLIILRPWLAKVAMKNVSIAFADFIPQTLISIAGLCRSRERGKESVGDIGFALVLHFGRNGTRQVWIERVRHR